MKPPPKVLSSELILNQDYIYAHGKSNNSLANFVINEWEKAYLTYKWMIQLERGHCNNSILTSNHDPEDQEARRMARIKLKEQLAGEEKQLQKFLIDISKLPHTL